LVAMVFDQYGNVQACCANALYPLGNVTRTTLREIWEGSRADAIRRALASADWSYGCGVCRYRVERSGVGVPLDTYELYPLDSTASTPEWPALLSFSLHNTCNLECVMCGGDSSSKIRTRRDGLPGLPHVYGESFFDQLEPFIEHCTNVDFVGGEPFLVREHERVWEMLMATGRNVAVSVTTNGTIWNDRVERWLDAFDTTVFLSIDGATRETFEAVRVGASHDLVMENLERFQAYTSGRGTQLILNWSLVRQNWSELGAMVRWAEERGLPMHVQTVLERDFGVQRMPTPELREVVETMEAESEWLVPDLQLNREVWLGEVARLRIELDSREQSTLDLLSMEPPDPSNSSHVAEVIFRSAATKSGRPILDSLRRRALHPRKSRVLVQEAKAELRSWSFGGSVGEILLDAGLAVVTLDVAAVFPASVGVESPPAGAHLSDLLDRWSQQLGGAMWVAEEFVEEDRVLHSLFFGPATRDKRGVVMRMISVPAADGVVTLVATDLSLLRPPTSADQVPVSIGRGGLSRARDR
jgi:MoaA/NifB/PqqE/SkfB family radical SAM enzyme